MIQRVKLTSNAMAQHGKKGDLSQKGRAPCMTVCVLALPFPLEKKEIDFDFAVPYKIV